MKTKDGEGEITFLGFLVTGLLYVIVALGGSMLYVKGVLEEKDFLGLFLNRQFLLGLCLAGICLVTFKSKLLDKVLIFFSRKTPDVFARCEKGRKMLGTKRRI